MGFFMLRSSPNREQLSIFIEIPSVYKGNFILLLLFFFFNMRPYVGHQVDK